MIAGSVDPAKSPRLSNQSVPSTRDIFALMALGSMLFAVLFAGFWGPWFTVVTHTTFAGAIATDDRGYGLLGYGATDTVAGTTAIVSGNYRPWPSVGSLVSIVQILIAVAVIASVSGFILLIIGRFRSRFVRLPVLLGLVAGSLTWVGALLFAATFPAAGQGDGLFEFGSFQGSSLTGDAAAPMTRTWGPGWAWWILPLAGSLFIVLPILLRRSARRPPNP
jgi:hypothetical protein